MSSTRRNIIAYILLLLSVSSWVFGQRLIHGFSQEGVSTTTETTSADLDFTETSAGTEGKTEATVYPPTDVRPSSPPSLTGMYAGQSTAGSRGSRLLGFLLCFSSAAFAVIGTFVFWQKSALLGPDGVCMLMGGLLLFLHFFQNRDYILWTSVLQTVIFWRDVLVGFVILVSVREVWGWGLSIFRLSWCLIYRIGSCCAAAQWSMLSYVGWIVLAAGGFAYGLFVPQNILALFFLITSLLFGIVCLWRYGRDLGHFCDQMERYQSGQQIAVSEGSFSKAEQQLLDIQAQHEEAVRTAVNSERFKVELIANVSHDLRTPLTSILGYGELLEGQPLTEEGRLQLNRLNQKAGYMNELVESLFELTKVSSGVVESRREQIDLIRLLEQTIGLFDDQLTHAGLSVRRNYCSENLAVMTDGARMHQVFANLLGNAIKYALPGTRIFLEVGQNEKTCTVRMMNTSSYEMDFKPEEIMQRFARGDKSRTSKGSGLGLAIAQTYTESVGGTFKISIDGDQFNAIVSLPII